MSNWLIYKSPERMGSVHSYSLRMKMPPRWGARPLEDGGLVCDDDKRITFFFPSYQQSPKAPPLGLPSSLPMGSGSTDEERSSAPTEGRGESRRDSTLAGCRSTLKHWRGGVKWLAGQVMVTLLCCPLQKQWPRSPCLGFSSVTRVLCRDLLYVSIRAEGLFFSSSVLENWKLSEIRKKLGNYCFKPHVWSALITCPESGCLLRKGLSNTLKCDSPSSVTVIVWFPEGVWQS